MTPYEEKVSIDEQLPAGIRMIYFAEGKKSE